MRTPEADRFQRDLEVPDPPLSPKGRQRYWDETVFEAVAELRKRLRSQDSEEALHALEMILDLEKTRIRHASKVSGTQVPNLRDLEDDWGNPLPRVKAETPPPGPLPVPERGCSTPQVPAPPESAATEPPPTAARMTVPQPRLHLGHPLSGPGRGPGGGVPNLPPRIPGVTGVFSDRDDDWTRDPHRGRIEGDDPIPPWHFAPVNVEDTGPRLVQSQ